MNRNKKRLVIWAVVCMMAGAGAGTWAMAQEKAPEGTVQETTAAEAEPAAAEAGQAEQAAAEAGQAAEASAPMQTETSAAVPAGPFVTEETPLLKEASGEAEELLVLVLNSPVEVLEPGDPEAEDSFAKVSFEGQEGYIPASLIGEYPVRYTTENLTLRAQPDKESEKLTIVALNKKVPVLELGNPEEEGGYSRILYKGQEGYVLTKYLTENVEEALQAQKEADAYEAAKAAAAERAASRRRNSSYEDDDDDDDVYEVSREKFDDCDGSGHGYYEITYSDGSTEIVEY